MNNNDRNLGNSLATYPKKQEKIINVLDLIKHLPEAMGKKTLKILSSVANLIKSPKPFDMNIKKELLNNEEDFSELLNEVEQFSNSIRPDSSKHTLMKKLVQHIDNQINRVHEKFSLRSH